MASDTAVILDDRSSGDPHTLHGPARRTTFTAAWTTVRLPFSAATGCRIRAPLGVTALHRFGIPASGRAFTADPCVARVGLYRDAAAGGY